MVKENIVWVHSCLLEELHQKLLTASPLGHRLLGLLALLIVILFVAPADQDNPADSARDITTRVKPFSNCSCCTKCMFLWTAGHAKVTKVCM